MRKKLAILAFALAAIAPTVAISPASAARPAPFDLAVQSCPKGSHLFVCPTYSFCCPNNAFCACLQ
jgi:hypothetical protein